VSSVSSVVLKLCFSVICVNSCQFVVAANQLDAELRRIDKGCVGKGIEPEKGATYSPPMGPSHAPWQKRIVQRFVRNRKIMRIYLVGMLCGVMLATAFTYVFALPANSDYWRMEIYKRGGAAWTVDKSGRVGWTWMVDPIPDTPNPPKPAVVPPSVIKVRSEQL
jgi:hypothetical protein